MSTRIATDADSADGSSPRPLGWLATEGKARTVRRPRALSLNGGSSTRFAATQDEREARLLFRLAASPNPTSGDQPLGASTNWSQLLQIAWEEGAATALRDHCSRLPHGIVPLDIERRLACLVLDRELRMRLLEQRTRESVAILQANGIQVGLLKGAALAATLYGSFRARPMKDVDLLVDPARADDAKQLMLSAGWSRDPVLPAERVYRTHHHLAPMLDVRGSRSRLEIHRALLPNGHPFALTMAEMWSGMEPAELGGQPVLVLAPTHHAVHIAIHFAWSHTLRAGGWHAFRDLGAMVRAGMIDWDELVRVATNARAASCCYWTLKLAREMTALQVPDDVLSALAPKAGSATLERLARHFVNVLLRRDAAHLSLRLDRGLWNMAIQPRQQGHGAVRPWLVSAELTTARLRDEPSAVRRPLRRVDRVARCTAYIARLLWT